MSAKDELLRLLDEFEYECFMLRVEATETKAKDKDVRDAYERIREESARAIAAWNSRAERICKIETDHDELEVIAYSHEDTWAYKCSVCDWSFRYDRGIKPNYCPNCGCKVVGK